MPALFSADVNQDDQGSAAPLIPSVFLAAPHSRQPTSILNSAEAYGYRDSEEAEWAWGLDALARSSAPAPETQHTALDRLRGQLLGDLRAALRHAYLGPR